MKRLCFLSPDLSHAQHVVRDLKDDGIEERHIYTLAKHGVDLQDLPDAGPEDNDFLPAFERGVALGGATGLFCGLLAVAFPPAGFVVGGGGVLLIGMMGASVGGLLTGMAGASFPNSRLQGFEEAIDAGKILVMVDVPLNKVDETNTLIRSHDPDVKIEGIEPPARVIPE
jgi:hypothetical protein